MPKDVEVILDLTSEFADRKQYRNDTRYVCLPTLDASTPKIADLRSILEKISDKCVFIHCAQGSGRTGMAALALLATRNPLMTLEEGLETLKKVRPGIRIKYLQNQFLNEYFFNSKSE